MMNQTDDRICDRICNRQYSTRFMVVCGIGLGHGIGFIVHFWYLSIYYVIPWVVFPLIAVAIRPGSTANGKSQTGG